ncbi:hypothetical protein GGI02_002287 [Coemansia sp. RSA 2322]|nr:hypothetical protein GGI02_002287 [Coemansia sp. RSA 2322]
MAPIQDCDEAFNYWEALHLLQFGRGKQTWEYAPQFALRSYAYVGVPWAAARAMQFVFGSVSRVQLFYALRIALALCSAACETAFVRAVARHVDRAMANYLLLGLCGMAGMFHAAPALLPSSSAMCLSALGSAAAMAPPQRCGRILWAVGAFAAAAVWSWPYAAVVAVPFAIEELLEGGLARMPSRAVRLAGVGGLVGAAMVVCAATIDSQFYGRPVVAAWNQIAYNVLRRGGGSELFGTEPWYFYLVNGLLNANLVMVLALASLPLWLAVTRGDSGQYRLLGYRLAPFFLTLLVFSAQPHKEERFLTIVYPHMCFNAAAALVLLRRPIAWPILSLTNRMPARFGSVLMCVAAGIGMLRMAALTSYYGAPTHAFMALPGHHGMIKSLAGSADGQALQPTARETASDIAVCMGADWYRFPSSYLLPPNHRLVFVASPAFTGHLPGDYLPTWVSGSTTASTSHVRTDFNGKNRWEPSHAIPHNMAAHMCDYFVGIDYPARHEEPSPFDYSEWRVVACEPFLDSENTSLLARAIYLPQWAVKMLRQRQQWGQMCVREKPQARRARMEEEGLDNGR